MCFMSLGYLLEHEEEYLFHSVYTSDSVIPQRDWRKPCLNRQTWSDRRHEESNSCHPSAAAPNKYGVFPDNDYFSIPIRPSVRPSVHSQCVFIAPAPARISSPPDFVVCSWTRQLLCLVCFKSLTTPVVNRPQPSSALCFPSNSSPNLSSHHNLSTKNHQPSPPKKESIIGDTPVYSYPYHSFAPCTIVCDWTENW